MGFGEGIFNFVVQVLDVGDIYLTAFDAREVGLVQVWKMICVTKSVTLQSQQKNPYRVFITSFLLKNTYKLV
jgi:hypothetical protein